MTTAQPIIIEQIRISEIHVNPLNREIFNEIGSDKRAALKKYIQDCGVLKPLSINSKNILLAGHARLDICKELGYETVPCQRMEFTDPAQEAEFMIKDNMLTRTLSPIESARAGIHLESGTKKYQRNGRPLRDIVAETLGISSAQYEKTKAIIESGDADMIRRVDRGETSVAKAYAILRTVRRKAEAKPARLEAPRFRLVNEDPLQAMGNFRPESCDCVIAEPPSQINPVWIDLVRRALRENGSLFVITQRNFPAIADAMDAGLDLVLPVSALIRTHQEGNFVYNHLTIAWLAKGGRGRAGVRDNKVSSVWDFRTAADPKTEILTRMMELATNQGDIVVHLFGDNHPIMDLADMLDRNIFAVQPDREAFIREKLNV